MKKTVLYILSYVSALLSSTVGLVFNEKWSQNPVVITIFAILSLLPPILLVIQIISAKRFMNKIQRSKVAEINAFLVSHRDDAEQTARRKLGELRRIRHLTTLYTVFVLILAMAVAILGGILIIPWGSSFYALCLFYSMFLFASVYARIHRRKQIPLSEDTVTLSKTD